MNTNKREEKYKVQFTKYKFRSLYIVLCTLYLIEVFHF